MKIQQNRIELVTGPVDRPGERLVGEEREEDPFRPTRTAQSKYAHSPTFPSSIFANGLQEHKNALRVGIPDTLGRKLDISGPI